MDRSAGRQKSPFRADRIRGIWPPHCTTSPPDTAAKALRLSSANLTGRTFAVPPQFRNLLLELQPAYPPPVRATP